MCESHEQMAQSATLNYENSQLLGSCFEAEVTPHITALHRYASRLSRNDMDAEDLVQETLLRAFRFWDRFIPGTNCRAWLLMILKNQHINEHRVKSRRPIQVNIDDVEDCRLINNNLFGRTSRAPDRELLDKCLDDELANAVCRLGDEHKEVVMSYHLYGLSYKQIADQSKLPLGTIKSRLYRGRKLLRAGLLEYVRMNRYVASCR